MSKLTLTEYAEYKIGYAQGQRDQLEELRSRVEKLDVSGGGSGRRFKFQFLEIINNLSKGAE